MHDIPQVEGGQEFSHHFNLLGAKPRIRICVCLCVYVFFFSLFDPHLFYPLLYQIVEKAKLHLESKPLYIVAVTIMKRSGLSPQ